MPAIAHCNTHLSNSHTPTNPPPPKNACNNPTHQNTPPNNNGRVTRIHKQLRDLVTPEKHSCQPLYKSEIDNSKLIKIHRYLVSNSITITLLFDTSQSKDIYKAK